MTPHIKSIQKFEIFTSEVKREISDIFKSGSISNSRVNKILNGAASEALDAYVAREARSVDGIFFSSHHLSELVVSFISSRLESNITVGDPSCGAGDLLLACASKFKMGNCLAETIESWSKRIVGCDLHSSFLDAARARLLLLAIDRQFRADSVLPIVESTKFSQLYVGNYFENIEKLADVDCIVMNPPFAITDSPKNCKWSSGKVQLAAIFLQTVLANAKEGQEIVAVLPDVLRSGTRYERWRKVVAEQGQINNIKLYGRFDKKTDVDVFILHVTKKSKPKHDPEIWGNIHDLLSTNKITVADYFTVSVGAFVPFRAKTLGRTVAYLDVSNALPDSEISSTKKCIFDGKLHQTPFIAIRRTSSPSDPRRIIPTLVTGPSEVCVENHLIVLNPIDGQVSTCKQLMKLLIDNKKNAWMNNAIRCRHLTTKAVKQIPLEDWQ